MASVDAAKLSPQELAELACTYSALILHDDGQDITADSMKNLINASGVKIEPYWPGIFAKALEGQDISSFFNFGGAGSSAPPAAPTTAPKEEAKKDTKKEKDTKPAPKAAEKPAEKPAEQEEDVGMGGLFD